MRKIRYLFSIKKKTKKKIKLFFHYHISRIIPSVIDRDTPWNNLNQWERDWFNNGKYPSCLTCKCGQWMVAIGQGFRCSNPNKPKTTDFNPKLWPIPHRTYVCEMYSNKRCKK